MTVSPTASSAARSRSPAASSRARPASGRSAASLAVQETVILLAPPLHPY